MESWKSHSPSRLVLFLLFFVLPLLFLEAAAGKRRVSIPDDLSDVVDDEEDEEWKKWGQTKTRSEDLLPPPDFSKMNPAEIQTEMMKRHTGPAYGFVKLRPGAARTRDDVPVIAMRWSNLIKTGSVEARFMAVDRHTIMFTMERGQDLKEVFLSHGTSFSSREKEIYEDILQETPLLEEIEFVLSQPEAYEMKIGEQLLRRPGDPPLDQVIEKLNREKETNHLNDEL